MLYNKFASISQQMHVKRNSKSMVLAKVRHHFTFAHLGQKRTLCMCANGDVNALSLVVLAFS